MRKTEAIPMPFWLSPPSDDPAISPSITLSASERVLGITDGSWPVEHAKQRLLSKFEVVRHEAILVDDSTFPPRAFRAIKLSCLLGSYALNYKIPYFYQHERSESISGKSATWTAAAIIYYMGELRFRSKQREFLPPSRPLLHRALKRATDGE